MTGPSAGRRAEFEESALLHVHALHAIALKLTRRTEEAEDLVQETLLRAYRFFHRYERGTNLRAWLLRIMRNLFINRYRQRRREPEAVDYGGIESTLEGLIAGRPEAPQGGGSPEEILASGEVDAEIERALAELPEEFRLVLLLSAMEGLSYKEIAGILDCPIGTVMSRLHRARRLMQSRLIEYARRRGLIAPAARGRGGNIVHFEDFRGAAGERGSGE